MQACQTSRLDDMRAIFMQKFTTDAWVALESAVARGNAHYSQGVDYSNMLLSDSVVVCEDSVDALLTLPNGAASSPADSRHLIKQLSFKRLHMRARPGTKKDKGTGEPDQSDQSTSVRQAADALVKYISKHGCRGPDGGFDCNDNIVWAPQGSKVASAFHSVYTTPDPHPGVVGEGALRRWHWEQDSWLQMGAQVTAGHIDHHQVLADMPRSCHAARKLWVVMDHTHACQVGWDRCENDQVAFAQAAAMPQARVLLMRPGDVLVLPPLTWHTWITEFVSGTPDGEQWAMVGGTVVMRESCVVYGLKYGRSGMSGLGKLAPNTAAAYTDSVLRPYWELCHSGTGERFVAERALEALRELDQAEGTSAKKRAASAKKGVVKKVEKKKRLAALSAAGCAGRAAARAGAGSDAGAETD